MGTDKVLFLLSLTPIIPAPRARPRVPHKSALSIYVRNGRIYQFLYLSLYLLYGYLGIIGVKDIKNNDLSVPKEIPKRNPWVLHFG